MSTVSSNINSIKQDIQDIEWILSIRKLPAKGKIVSVFNRSSADTKRAAKHYWSYSAKQLKARKAILELEIDNRISLMEHQIYS